MSSTLLQLVQEATGEMGLAVPTAVVGVQSTDTIQQLALINAVGREIMRGHDWQALVMQNIFTVTSTTLVGDTTLGSVTVTNIADTTGIDATYQISGTGLNQATFVVAAPSSSTLTLSQPATSSNAGVTFILGKVKYAMPSDYDRQIDRTHWDKSKHWEMLGPETPQQWEWLLSGYISTGPRIRYRILGNKFQILPLVSQGEVLGFEYVSNAWALSAAGVPGITFAADTDTCVFSDRLMVLGLKKKYFQVKGFDASAFAEEYKAELNIAKSNEAGSATLSLSPRVSNVLINWNQIPDSGYGS